MLTQEVTHKPGRIVEITRTIDQAYVCFIKAKDPVQTLRGRVTSYLNQGQAVGSVEREHLTIDSRPVFAFVNNIPTTPKIFGIVGLVDGL